MSITVYQPAGPVGNITIESDQIGWIQRGEEHIGRIEVDWGNEDQEHIASVYISGNCIGTLTLERYGQDVGKIMRGFDEIGQVRPEGKDIYGVYRGEERIGHLENKNDNISSKHIILFGGIGAAVLVGLCLP